jgi:hypothetical protein
MASVRHCQYRRELAEAREHLAEAMEQQTVLDDETIDGGLQIDDRQEDAAP